MSDMVTADRFPPLEPGWEWVDVVTSPDDFAPYGYCSQGHPFSHQRCHQPRPPAPWMVQQVERTAQVCVFCGETRRL